MQFDFEKMPPSERYKLLLATVLPRPIAWVTTRDSKGAVNAAPFAPMCGRWRNATSEPTKIRSPRCRSTIPRKQGWRSTAHAYTRRRQTE